MPRSSAALLKHLATQVRELREFRGWTPAELATQLRLPVEEAIELEEGDFDAAPLVRGLDGSVDIAPWMRRRWLNRLAAAIETLSAGSRDLADAARHRLQAGIVDDDRAVVIDLLSSNEPKDWWAGARLAVLFDDKAAVPLLREIAFARRWAAGRLSRDRAFWALAQLGIPVGAPAGSLALADLSDSGRLALASENGAVSLPGESSETPSRTDALGEEPERTGTMAGVAFALRVLAFVMCVVVVLLAIGAWCFGEWTAAMLFGLGVSVAAAFLFGRRLADDVFTWTRKRWARNRAQRLRGS